MRKTLAIALTAVTLTLAGCGVGAPDEASAPVTVTETTTPQATTSTTGRALEGSLRTQMKEVGIPTGGLTHSLVTTAGEAACEAADSGLSNPEILEIVVDSMDGHWDVADSVLFIELSFMNLCPGHATI